MNNYRLAISFLIMGSILSCDRGKNLNRPDQMRQNNGSAEWAFNVGVERIFFHAVATDTAGNMFAVGQRDERAYPGQLTNPGSNAIIVKYRASGNYEWQHYLWGDVKDSRFRGVVADESNDIIVVGSQTGKRQCKLNDVEFTGATEYDNAFVAKLDQTGKTKWITRISRAEGHSILYGVDVDGSGNIYATGFFNGGTLQMDGKSLSATTGQNPLIVKLSRNGSVKWLRTADAAQRGAAFHAVKVSAQGRIFVAGYQSGSSGGTNTYGDFSLADPHDEDTPLLLRYKANGEVESAYIAGKIRGSANFKGLAIDTEENIFLTGEYDGKAPLSIGKIIVTPGPNTASIVAKFTADLQPVWAKSTGMGRFETIAVDNRGNAYVGGQSFAGRELLGNAAMQNCQENIATLAKFNKDGNAVWQKMSDCVRSGTFAGIDLDATGRLVAAGVQYDAVRFGAVRAGIAGTSAGLIVRFE